MTINQERLIKKVKLVVKELRAKGKSLKEAQTLVYGVLLPLKSEIDKDNIFSAIKGLNNLI